MIRNLIHRHVDFRNKLFKLKTVIGAYIFVLMLVLGVADCVIAANDKYVDPYKGYDETLFMDMDLEQNVMSPMVSKTEHAAISHYMKRLGTQLSRKGYIVDLTRDDEVIIITIPSDDLFQPNDTLLSPGAPAKLTPVVQQISGDPAWMKVVYAVHTDNTGSETYNQSLSHARNSSLYDWLLPKVNENLIVIPYEMGDTDPIEPNDTRRGRAANRRVEFFLIPGPKMITQAHAGLLK